MTNSEIEMNALRKATPIARKWAATQMKEGKNFCDIEDRFMSIMSVENKLYNNMKDALVSHISRHGLDAQSLVFFDMFKEITLFDKNSYNRLLSKIRKAYAHSEDSSNRSLEYLIAKITEYLRKITDLNKTVWKMLQEGNGPDFNAWSDKVVIQDLLFEENKQFLKQTLHHLEVLERNNVRLGVAEIRLLLYHKEGCRREKLYRRTEEWLLRLWYCLKTKEERDSVYKDICLFIKELVPQVGYISPMMSKFIFSDGYISFTTYDLLVSIHPVIKSLSMEPIIRIFLERFFEKTKKHLTEGSPLTETDIYAYELTILYSPQIISAQTAELWEEFNGNRQQN